MECDMCRGPDVSTPMKHRYSEADGDERRLLARAPQKRCATTAHSVRC